MNANGSNELDETYPVAFIVPFLLINIAGILTSAMFQTTLEIIHVVLTGA